MGAFWGHVDMGIFFIVLGLWWLYNTLRDYFLSGMDLQKFRSRVSYGLPCKPNIPIETILKLLFIGIVILFELGTSKLHFIDEQGHFVGIIFLQHLTMFGLFFIHSIIDLMEWLNVPIPRGSGSITAALAFGWTALSMAYHVEVGNRPKLDVVIHMLPNYGWYIITGAVVWEYYCDYKGIIVPIIRSYGSLFVGTWFFQAGWVLFARDTFPGSEPNPDWDQSDPRNAHFIVIAYGLHIMIDAVIVAIIYTMLYFIYRPQSSLKGKQLCMFDKEKDESTFLLLNSEDPGDQCV